MTERADDAAARAALPSPAVYLPFLTGRYDVKPGLKRFGSDFGNGGADQRLFQIDDQFRRYRAAKMEARRTAERCVITQDYPAEVADAVAQFIAGRLVSEWPHLFQRTGDMLRCVLTAETIDLRRAQPPWRTVLDALACQVQEDLAVTVRRGDRNWLAALHVCLPSHWDPRQKIGGTFMDVHQVVPGMAAMNQRQHDFVRQMIESESGLVRFVWGLQRGVDLNRHPDAAHDENGEWHLRSERQTIWGLPAVEASLFTIRPYLMPLSTLRRSAAWRDALIAALRGMSDESARYKGLHEHRDELITLLSQEH